RSSDLVGSGGVGSRAATTSICLFLNSPNIPPFLISLLCNMTASEPNSFLICCIASGIDFAKYFFIFMLHSPPPHFAPVHLDPTHYKTKRQLEVNFFPTVALYIRIVGEHKTTSCSFCK